MRLLDIYARKKKDIDRIEAELERVIHSEHALLNETSLHLLKAGGKRIRPVFVLLAGEFGTNHLETLEKVAVALELIHMASLVHDDVIDDAETRRGEATVKARWDNRIAMYTGDYIFAKAFMVITDLTDPVVHHALSKAIVQMSIGEIEQIRLFYDTEQSVRDYLLRIRRKTALLIAISCQLGGVVSHVEPRLYQALYTYGYNVGMAFQIRDDILDLTGTEKELGKPPGSDILQGNVTLPIIYALEEPAIRTALLEQIASLKLVEDEPDLSQFLRLVQESQGIERAEQLVKRYIAKALDALEVLPATKTNRSLADIAHFIGKRKY